jgi:hypothetical protein
MDPLSTTVSVIVVVTAASQCAKTIHSIISGIRDGPTYIQELDKQMRDIHDILNELKNLGERIIANKFVGLEKTIQRCANDLAMFEGKVIKVREVHGEKRWG